LDIALEIKAAGEDFGVALGGGEAFGHKREALVAHFHQAAPLFGREGDQQRNVSIKMRHLSKRISEYPPL